MFKRILLAALCVSALGVSTLATPDTAEARRYWRRPYASYYYGPPVNYGWRRPYRYYYSPRYYPRYYAPYRYRYYGYPDYYYSGPRGRVAFRIGW
jgi:hypothetical protein